MTEKNNATLDDVVTVLARVEDRLMAIDRQLTDLNSSAASREKHQADVSNGLDGITATIAFWAVIFAIFYAVNEAWPWLWSWFD